MQSDLEAHARARVGAVIHKKYRLEKVIGLGGMATVYEAAHRNGHRVAIKMLHSHLSIDADIRARFLREGYVANKVDHPGAVRVLDDDTAEDGSVFLVMELLEGETLDARWGRSGGRLPARDVCGLAHQLLDVLGAAHAKGIVHRDIKPENLFLTSEGQLKVLDFGIARLRETTGLEGATKTGRMIGTPAFMPPEQVLGKAREIDGQTDIYAVGATMFTLVSGQFVHQAETMEEMLVRAGSQEARSVAVVSPELAKGIAAVIDRALVFDKQGRWPDVRTMGEALGEAYRTAYGSLLPAVRGSRPPHDANAPSLPQVAPKSDPTRDDPEQADRLTAPMLSGPAPSPGTEFARPWPFPDPAATRMSTSAGLAAAAGADHAVGLPGARRIGGMWFALGGITLLGLGGSIFFLETSPLRERLNGSPAREVSAHPAMSLDRPVAAAVVIPSAAPQPPLVAVSSLPVARASTEVPTEKPDAGVPRTTPAPARVARPVPHPASPILVIAPPPMPVPTPTPTVAAPPAPEPPPKPNCDVPFYVDKQGIQRIRPECK